MSAEQWFQEKGRGVLKTQQKCCTKKRLRENSCRSKITDYVENGCKRKKIGCRKMATDVITATPTRPAVLGLPPFVHLNPEVSQKVAHDSILRSSMGTQGANWLPLKPFMSKIQLGHLRRTGLVQDCLDLAQEVTQAPRFVPVNTHIFHQSMNAARLLHLVRQALNAWHCIAWRRGHALQQRAQDLCIQTGIVHCLGHGSHGCLRIFSRANLQDQTLILSNAFADGRRSIPSIAQTAQVREQHTALLGRHALH